MGQSRAALLWFALVLAGVAAAGAWIRERTISAQRPPPGAESPKRASHANDHEGLAPRDAGEGGTEPVAALTRENLERVVMSVARAGTAALVDETDTWRAWRQIEDAGDSAIAALLDFLSGPEHELRLGAAALLAVGKPHDAALPLSRALEKETDPETRRVIVEALARLEDEDAATALLAVWSDPAEDSRSRRSALMGLACLGHAAAIAAVADPRLGAIERRLAESGLVRALQIRPPEQTTIRDAVRWIAAHSPHESARMEAAEVVERVTR